MTPPLTASDRRNLRRIIPPLLGLIVFASGCASPPSTEPLLEVVQSVLTDEQRHLETDRQRAAAWFDSQREGLRHGFEADLDEQPDPGRDWLTDHVTVYVAAREALLREQMNHDRQLEQRITNLTHARQANRRAAELLRRQDELLTPLTGWQRWARGQLENQP